MLARWTQRFRGARRSQGSPRPVVKPQVFRTGTSSQDIDKEGGIEPDDQAGSAAAGKHRREALLRTEPRQRWNASVKPRGQAFKEIVSIFEEKLAEPETTVQNILDEYFTRHERELVIPADKRRNRALAKIQRRNRARYRILMRSQRFAPWADQATTLKLKLAMLWFGLPVAPIEFDWEDELASGSDTADDIAEIETDKNREKAAKDENRLRFLNSYGQRHFGRDHLRRPDPTYEAYYALNHLYPVVSKKKRPGIRRQPAPVSLRGGGLSEDLLDMDVDDFNEPDIDVENLSDTGCSNSDHNGEDQASFDSAGVSLRGGAAGKTNPLLKKALGLSDQLYEPRADNRPGVRFQAGSVPPGRAADEEVNKAEPVKRKEKGKEPARDYPGEGNPFIKPAIPKRQPLNQEERQREMREATYANPPSVHKENKIPQNAPPLEKMLQFGSDNVPSISLGVLTPTEQRNLQTSYYNMRNTLLERSQKCPYSGCDRVISLGEEDRMQQHLAEAHMGDSCNFCDEVLYQHWTVNQRRAHFLSNHIDLFLDMHHVQDDNSFKAAPRPHGQVDYDRESRYTYCPRCGREHTTLDAQADREHHDLVCYPGAPEGDWIACHKCGVLHSRIERHQCRKVANTMEWPYCARCGLGMGLFSDLYRGRHQLHCMGFRTEDVRRCPWCQQDLEEGPNSLVKLSHIEHCGLKPAPAAQGPLDPETGKPWPYKPALKEVEGEPEQEPPQRCTLCEKTIIHFDAHLLLKHIEDNHADFTAFCIFCKLDYHKRGWGDDRKKILRHLDDHIHDRKATMAADLVETMHDLPFNHPYRRKALRDKDYADVKDRRELERTKQLYDALWDSSRRQIEESNNDKRQIDLVRRELLKREKELAEAKKALKAVKAKEGGQSTEPAPTAPRATPAVNPFAPTPAIGQKKDKGKGKVKPTPAQKVATEPASTTQPAPSATTKRKASRPTKPSGAVGDPSYRPTSSSSDTSSTDNEFRKEEARLRRANKRKKTANQDPSYRPRPEDQE